MITRRVANFEKFILTPLSFLLPVVALIYFFQTAWFVGAWFLFAWFYVGLVGQSIHKDKSFDDLTQGGLTAEENIKPDSGSEEDALKLAMPLLSTSCLFGITTSVLLFHYGFRWLVSIPIGFSGCIVMPMIFVILFARPKKKIIHPISMRQKRESKLKSKINDDFASKAEVFNVSPQGFWLFVAGKDYYLWFDDFPKFRSATASQLFNVEFDRERYLFWPELNIDLDLEHIEHFGKPPPFPIVVSR